DVVDAARDSILRWVAAAYGSVDRRLGERTQCHCSRVRGAADFLAQRVQLLLGHPILGLTGLNRDPLHAEANLTGGVVNVVLELVAGVVTLRRHGGVDCGFGVLRKGWPYCKAPDAGDAA